MDEIETHGRASGDRGSGAELELADYLQGLLAEAVSEKTSGCSPRWRTPVEETVMVQLSDPPDPPGDDSAAGLSGKDADPSETPPSHSEVPPAGRASMSEELAALFRPTEQPPPVSSEGIAPSETPVAMGEAATGTLEPSVYLRRFLHQAARPSDVVPSGIAGLDTLLNGGFGPGLHLVAGSSKLARTAFLDSLIWETATSERPVVYYALREGGLAVWERLVSTLSGVLGGPTVTLAALRARELAAEEVEALTLLDEALQLLVLPLVSLVDLIPSHADGHAGFVEDVASRIRQARQRHGRTPLLIVDDLERLSFLVRPRRDVHLLLRLGEVLSAVSAPGLVAAAVPTQLATGRQECPARTTLVLEPIPSTPADDFELLDLRIAGSSQTGQTGSLQLLIDRQTTLVSEYSPTAQPEVTPQ